MHAFCIEHHAISFLHRHFCYTCDPAHLYRWLYPVFSPDRCTKIQLQLPVPGNPLISTTSPAPASPQTARSAGIDTTIDIHSNDFNCLDVQQELGVDYLYPDQKFRVWATSPGNGQESVNVLFIDVSDRDRIQTSPPVWDEVKKSWIYEGLVPIIQFNDVTVPRETTMTIKKQGKYFLCADDRKETGMNDAILRVPVKLTRI